MISHIDPINNITWKSPFITIDIDWAHNTLISDTIDLLEKMKRKQLSLLHMIHHY